MKKLYAILCLSCMLAQTAWAMPVKVTMNTTSTTMSLQKKGGEPVDVGTPASRVYTFDAEAGEYILTAYATNGTTTTENGTIELNIAEGAANEFSVLTCTAYATNSGWTEGNDYTFAVDVNSREGEKQVITIGNSTTAGRKTFLALTGNTYNAQFVPNAAHQAEGYMTLNVSNTLTANANVTGAIPVGAEYTVTVPATAEFFIGQKVSHFMAFRAIEPKSVVTEGSKKKYTFQLGNGVQYNYRTWKQGGLTQTGLFYMNTDATKRPALAFTDADYAALSPKYINNDVTANGGYNVADILLNVNARHHMKMNIGDKFDLLAQRNWQVIESTTNNYFIEPDYHYTVQSLTEGKTADQIVSLENANTTIDPWNQMTAVGEGTVLVTVTYDAMSAVQYSNAGVKSNFVGGEYWSAIWPENTGVFVVTVGQGETGISPNILINQGKNNSVNIEKQEGDNYDAAFDVFYFRKGTQGYAYTFRPEGVASVKVAYPTIGANAATYAGFGTEGVTDNGDGSYTVLLKNGRQIVALYDAEGKAEYQVMNAREVEYTVQNASRPGAEKFLPGESVSVKFQTLYHPANKLAGIHNFAAVIDYSDLNGATFKGTSNQYLFASTAAAQTANFTLPTSAEGTITLGGGTIKVTGFGDPIGNHRATSRTAGRNANFTAIQHTCYFGSLPQIEIPVSEAQYFDVYLQLNVQGAGALVLDANGKPVVADKDGKRSMTYGTYTYEAKATGYRPSRGSFTIGESQEGDVTVEIALQQLPEGAWDGTTKTEPAQVGGVYQISNGAELAWFANTVNGGTYTAKGALTQDIDLGDFAWTPIGGTTSAKAFRGTFDGQGHKVSGLYINSTTATYQGLFGYTNGTAAAPVTINNVVVEGEVTAKQYAGGIAAYMGAYVSMDRVGNKANVTSAGTYTGGVTGYVSAATAKITNAFNTGDVTGTTNVGGLAGSNNATAVINNVYSIGNVTGTTVGAVLGGTTAKTNVKNAYAISEYGITAGQTTISADDVQSGKLAYILGEPWGQDLSTERFPIPGGKKVYLLADQYVNTYNDLKGYEVRTLTFEDADSKGKINVATGETEWSSMIDSEQYGGPILYDENGAKYWWHDANNTELMGGGNDYYMEYWTGGWAISNYYKPDVKGTSYDEQLSIAQPQSDNQFAVVYNYRSGSPYDMTAATPLEFADGKAHVIQSADVALTSYTLNSLLYGDSFAVPAGPDSWFAVNFEGTHADESTSTVTVKLFQNQQYTTDWTTVDLTSLGAVTSLNVYMTGSEDLCGDYGMNVPGYVAVDNIAVRFQKDAIELESLDITDDVPYTVDAQIKADQVTYTRNSAAEWGTICLPFAVQSDNQIQYYQLSDVTDGAFRIRAVESVEAGVPAVYKKLAEGESVQVSAQNVTLLPAAEYQKSSTTIQDWEMKGTFAETTIQGVDKYFIAQNKFWFAEAPVTVRPFRGWFQTSAPSGSRQMIITVDDDQQTGILTLDQNGDLHSAEIFDLQGNRITRGHKGQIVIINGNKVILK